jgi:uncharacterized protein
MDNLHSLFSDQPELEKKYHDLVDVLKELQPVSIAFSGGVDSSLLVKVAYENLQDKCLALIGNSPSFPPQELEEAKQLAQQIGVTYEIVETSEMQDARYLENPPDRCFHCRIHSMEDLLRRSKELGFKNLVDGANVDDASDYRPGRKAAKQMGLRSPLLEASIHKQEVRALARAMQLPVWDKPAAACLSSRIPYGTTITIEALKKINQAELALKKFGFNNVRVRHYDELARIEIDPEAFDRVIKNRVEIAQALKDLGYTYITLDLDGFRSGSMNLPLMSR